MENIIEHETLVAAFVHAQMEFHPIVHNCVVDFQPQGKRRVHYTYADLVQMQKALYPALNKHGLSISYNVVDTDGRDYVVTIMRHAFSDDKDEVRLRMAGAEDPKDMAAEYTYLKRYGLGLITGTASEEDNDADRLPQGRQQAPPKDAEKPASEQQQPEGGKTQPGQQKAAEGADTTHMETALSLRVRTLAKECGYPDLKEYLGHSSKDLNTKQWSELEATFKRYKAAAQWLAKKIETGFSVVIQFSLHYPGGLGALTPEIKKVKEGTSIDQLMADFLAWEDEDGASDPLVVAQLEYSGLIDGKFDSLEKRVEWEKSISKDAYDKWGIDEHTNAITALVAEATI